MSFALFISAASKPFPAAAEGARPLDWQRLGKAPTDQAFALDGSSWRQLPLMGSRGACEQ